MYVATNIENRNGCVKEKVLGHELSGRSGARRTVIGWPSTSCCAVRPAITRRRALPYSSARGLVYTAPCRPIGRGPLAWNMRLPTIGCAWRPTEGPLILPSISEAPLTVLAEIISFILYKSLIRFASSFNQYSMPYGLSIRTQPILEEEYRGEILLDILNTLV